MLNLFLTILFTSWLLIAFRVFEKFKIDNLQAIVVNYIVCVFTGLLFSDNYTKLSSLDYSEDWIKLTLLTGSCFLPTFFLMSYTVKKVSVTVSAIANKTSLIIPVTVSILFLNKGSLSWLNLFGLVLGIGAIVMSSIKSGKEEKTETQAHPIIYFLPMLVFLGGGLVDVLINISNFKYLTPYNSSLFPLFAFSAAAFWGILVLLLRQEKITVKNILGGIVLGIPNFFSIYFLLKSLKDFNNDGALIFPALNISVIIINSMIAVVFFKEKLSKFNVLGLILALISLAFVILE